MKIVTGPVIGQITDKVTILLEFDEVGDVTVEIYPLDEKTRVEWRARDMAIQARSMGWRAFRPHVLRIGPLEAGMDYGYEITHQNVLLAKSCFRVPGREEPLKTLVVSCNALHMLKKGELDLWDCILRDHGGSEEKPPECNLLLHIGDQIYEYNRDVWKRCYQYMLTVQEGGGTTTGEKLMGVDQDLNYAGEWTAEPGPYTLEEVQEVMTELFRSIYRQNWNHPPTKKLMSRISNQMIIDDHDIRNGWGILKQDRDPDSIEYTIGQAAHRAYEEYQVQLWRDLDNKYHVDHRSLRRSRSCIFLLDVRNPRTFCYNDKAPYVGFEQMSSLQKVLSDPTLDNLMVVCSIPIILSSEQATEIAAHLDVTYDTRDQWCQGPNKAEHCTILSILAEWKKKRPERSLLLVGGDIHMGLESAVCDGETPFCNQIVTSPITNEPTLGIVGWLQDTFVRNTFTLYGRFKITHGKRVHKRNYAVINQDIGNGWVYVLHDQ